MQPTAVLTTAAAAEAVRTFLLKPRTTEGRKSSSSIRYPTRRDAFAPTHIDVDDISHLQYTRLDALRPEITHRRSAPICCR